MHLSSWGWSVLWLIWIAQFFAIEIPALVNKDRGDTLSEHVWKWFAISGDAGKSKSGGYRARRFTLIAFLAWLVAHFVTGGHF